MKASVKKWWSSEEGASLIIVALSLVVLIGFLALVADAGTLFYNRRQLVTVADAAALAGAGEYGKEMLSSGDSNAAASKAYDEAKEYANKNGVPDSQIENISVDKDNRTVSVDVYRNDIKLAFAPVLGITEGKRKAHAKTITGPVSSGIGAAPLFFPRSIGGNPINPTPGSEWTLKCYPSGNVSAPGDCGILGLGGNTGNPDYLKQLKWGYNGIVKVSEVIDTLQGNKIDPTRSAIDYYANTGDIDSRLQRCKTNYHKNGCDGNCTWNDYKPGCPRVVVIPICNIDDLNKNKVTVEAFASFFIKSYEGVQGQGSFEIKGVFIEAMSDGQVGPPGTPDYGTWGVNLIE